MAATTAIDGACDLVLTALCLWREARGEALKYPQALVGVAWVIRNRSRDGRWPPTAWDVILQKHQFTSFSKDDPNATKWPQAGDKTWAACKTAAVCAVEDPTKGANHYHSYPKGHQAWPQWAQDSKLTVEIGPFKFYKL